MAVLITGGTKGIGLAIAKRVARPGLPIFMAYERDDASADLAAAEVAASGAVPYPIRVDVNATAGVQALAAKVAEHVDRLDHVVHGAPSRCWSEPS